MATINPLQGPINYSVDVQSPFEAAIGGFKLGAAGAEAQAQAQVREQAKKAQTELATLFKNPNATATDFARVSSMLPRDQAESVLKSFELMSTSQQKNRLQESAQVYTALKSGQLDIAKTLLQKQADAFRTGGKEQEAKATETYLQLVDMNPTGAQTTIGLMMASLPGGKELLENVDKTLSTGRAEDLAPQELRQKIAAADEAVAAATTAQATATNAAEQASANAALARAQSDKAKVDAQYAERNALVDLKKKSADIRKTDADILIAQEDNRIKALNAAQAKETNELRKKELQQKIDDAKEKRDVADRDQKATLANQVADIDNFFNTATRIKQTPRDIINAATGPIASRLLTTNQDVSDFESLVETLSSQAFLAQIPKIKGTGNLTEKEGDKLQASLQNLSLRQSPDRLLANVDEAVRLLEKARVNITARSGLPALPSDVPAKLNVTVGGTTYNFPTIAAADTFRNSDAYKKAAGIK